MASSPSAEAGGAMAENGQSNSQGEASHSSREKARNASKRNSVSGQLSRGFSMGGSMSGFDLEEDQAEGKEYLNITKLQILVRHKYAISVLMLHFFRYLIFIVFFALIVLLQRNASFSNDLSSALYNNFCYDKFRIPDTYQLMRWMDIVDFAGFWAWHLGPFLDNFYSDTYDNGKPRAAIDQQTVMTHIKFAGGIRMVQRRAKNGTCTPTPQFAQFAPNCFGPVLLNGLFGNVNKDPFVGAHNQTVYKFEKFPSPFLIVEEGYFQFFGGRGAREETRQRMMDLMSDRWLDESTTYVRTDFVAYNPNINMLAQVEFEVQVSIMGELKPVVTIETMRLKEYSMAMDYVRLVLELVFLGILASLLAERFNTVKTVMKATRCTLAQALYDGWELYEWSQLILLLIIIALRLYLIFNPALQNLRVTQDDIRASDGSRLDLSATAQYTTAYFTLCGIVMGVSVVKFYRYLRVNIQLSVLTQTIIEMQGELLQFLGMMASILFLWSCAGVVFFGDASSDFRNLGPAWEFCFLSFLGILGRSDLFYQLGTNELNDTPAQGYLFYYPFNFIMVFVALNITVSIILEAYERVVAHCEFLEEKTVLNVLTRTVFVDQVWKAMYNMWISTTAPFLKSSHAKLSQRMSDPDMIRIAGYLMRHFDPNYDEISERSTVRMISARPETGFYRLYTNVGLGLKEENPDVIVRVSQIRRALKDSDHAAGIPWKVLSPAMEELDVFCGDPAGRDTEKLREKEAKNRQALEDITMMTKRAGQILDDLERASVKVDLLMKIHMPPAFDPADSEYIG